MAEKKKHQIVSELLQQHKVNRVTFKSSEQKEAAEIKQIQTQLNLHNQLADLPIVVKADPQLLVKGNQPSFQIMQTSLRQRPKIKKMEYNDSVMNFDRLDKYSRTDFHTEIYKMEMARERAKGNFRTPQSNCMDFNKSESNKK